MIERFAPDRPERSQIAIARTPDKVDQSNAQSRAYPSRHRAGSAAAVAQNYIRPALKNGCDQIGHLFGIVTSIRIQKNDDVRIPRTNLLCEPGDGLKILFSALNKSRPSIAAHALGIARAAFEEAVAYINQRRQSGRNIIESIDYQWKSDTWTQLRLRIRKPAEDKWVVEAKAWPDTA